MTRAYRLTTPKVHPAPRDHGRCVTVRDPSFRKSSLCRQTERWSPSAGQGQGSRLKFSWEKCGQRSRQRRSCSPSSERPLKPRCNHGRQGDRQGQQLFSSRAASAASSSSWWQRKLQKQNVWKANCRLGGKRAATTERRLLAAAAVWKFKSFSSRISMVEFSTCWVSASGNTCSFSTLIVAPLPHPPGQIPWPIFYTLSFHPKQIFPGVKTRLADIWRSVCQWLHSANWRHRLRLRSSYYDNN